MKKNKFYIYFYVLFYLYFGLDILFGFINKKCILVGGSFNLIFNGLRDFDEYWFVLLVVINYY